MKHFYPVWAKAMLLALLVMSGAGVMDAQYCKPVNDPGWGCNAFAFISQVNIGSFVRSSGFTPGCYDDQSSTYIDVFRQAPLTLSITGSSQGSCMAWIDYNADGIFNTTNEYVGSGSQQQSWDWATSTISWTPVLFTVTLPCSMKTGPTRIRLMYSYPFFTTNNACFNPGYGETEDYTLNVVGDMVRSFPDDAPDDRAILVKGLIYDGSSTTVPQPSVTLRTNAIGQQVNVTYRIIGPLPFSTVQYTASWTAISSVVGQQTFGVPNATGPMAGINGALDTRSAIGGEYQLQVSIPAAGTTCATDWIKSFTIAVNRDVSANLIRSPRSNEAPANYKYPNTAPAPVVAVFQNTGLDTLKAFKAIAQFFNASNTEIYRDEVMVTEILPRGVRTTVNFKNFTPQGTGHPVGIYTAKFCAEIVDPFPDENPFNDCLPRSIQPPFQFEIQFLEEPAVFAVNTPSATQVMFANRSFRPEAVYANNGIQDLSNVPVNCTIYKLPGRQIVYNQNGIVPDIGAGQFNKSVYTFPAFTPVEGGQYDFCFSVTYPGDPVTTNNLLCVTRTIDANLSGIYTIGTTQPGPRNYLTIDAAVNDLYLKGVSGPVTFEFTDANYTVSRTGLGTPGIDLSSRILGVGATNPVLFKPSLNRSLSRAAVNIRIETESGLGVLLGQNGGPSNPNAIQNQQYFNTAANARSAGYIEFNGGSQRSLRFQIAKRVTSTTSRFNAGFYLTQGSVNHTVANTIIEVAPDVTPMYNNSLPIVRYNAGSNAFRFDLDVRAGNVSYTAGIVSRDTINPDNRGNLDTIPNVNNKFTGNEINGFGYGIVSTGIGALIKGNNFQGFYNTGTEISNNTIYNVARAGVFVGYEDGAKITGNRIYNVGSAATGTSVNDAAGIIAGGETRYNNVDLMITRNEVSGVVGNTNSRGIVVEQDRNDYQSVLASGGIVSFPNRAEHTMLNSNVVWGLRRGTASGSMAGIHLFTLRATSTDPVTALLTPSITTYFTQKDTIANNTILMENDNTVGAGAIVGIGTQNGNGTVIMNNAIAVLGNAGAATLAQTAILYQGTLFRNGRFNAGYLPTTAPAALISNKNAFWTPNASIVRFVEISHTSQIVSVGTNDEFSNLAQWRNWTNQDLNSIYGDWTVDMVFNGIAPNQQLRVNLVPTPPRGSILNNRGERILAIKSDIDGNARGGAGLGYDIGASEFDGQLYVNDNEAVSILSPSAYRRTTGPTSDAEYIMTKAPVDVRAQVQNNGSLPSSNTKVRVQIFLQTAASNNAGMSPAQFNATAVVDRTVSVTMNSGDIKTVTFNIPNWTPQVYAGMGAYTVPTQFSNMTFNVTPLYRIDVSLQSDENNANNLASKTVRFYLQRSQMSVVLSARGSNAGILTGAPTTTTIAGRLNADTALKAFGYIGWVNDPSTNNYAYDVFDRTSWEDRAVDYSIYRTMFWSHDNTAFTRGERDDIRNFIGAGTTSSKKNLALYSQEPARRHIGLDPVNDEAFVRNVLRATNVSPGTPTPAPPVGANYSGKFVNGMAIARNSSELISRTGFLNDGDPIPGLVRVYSDASTSGIANNAYSYRRGDRTTPDSIMGVATASLTANVVFLSVDWRHFARTVTRTGIERALRGTIDFFVTNGGTVVPVELSLFDAKARGTNVDVFWSTASEKNTDHFTVERAPIGITGIASRNAFTTVTTVSAAGNSTKHIDYRHTDENVAAGSYLYRLTAVDMDGSSTQSDEVQVTIVDGTNALWMSDVSPNPVSNDASISFVIPTSGNVELKLFSVSGTEVLTIVNGDMSAGRHDVNMSAANLPAGSYRLVLRAGDNMATKTVTVVK